MGAVRGDEGAILLVVLFVTTVLAVLIGVILTSVDVNLRNSAVVRDLDDKTYAADGGVEYVVQRLRQDPGACSDPNLGPWHQNNVTVDVSCSTVPGALGFGSKWAVVTTSTGPESLETDTGVPVVVVNGPAYVAGGLTLPSNLTVTNGLLLQASPPCSGAPQPGARLINTVSGCTSTPAGTARPALPCLVSCAPGTQYTFSARGAEAAYTVNGCSIFLPGKYTAAPALGPHNYFASGVYYFENVGTIDVDGRDVFGGNRADTEMTFVDQSSPCADDGQAGVSDGSGVEWILGGTSVISVGSAAGTSFELFARQQGTSKAEGASGLSIRSVPAGTAGYAASTSDIFVNEGGPGAQVAIHGGVYAPDAKILVHGTNNAGGAVLAGGVVASTLTLHARTDVSNNTLVATPPTSDGHQFFTISSTAKGNGGSKDVTTTAVIEISDADRTVAVDSWATNAA